jgi:hypothetical protein
MIQLVLSGLYPSFHKTSQQLTPIKKYFKGGVSAVVTPLCIEWQENGKCKFPQLRKEL